MRAVRVPMASMTEINIAVAAAAASMGGAGGSFFTSRAGSRKVDKVDAVQAIGDAYRDFITKIQEQNEAVLAQMQVQVDAANEKIDRLERVVEQKDERYERLLEKLISIRTQPVAPVAPVAPVLPVAPVYIDRTPVKD
jgi:uncharacterized protein HemX